MSARRGHGAKSVTDIPADITADIVVDIADMSAIDRRMVSAVGGLWAAMSGVWEERADTDPTAG